MCRQYDNAVRTVFDYLVKQGYINKEQIREALKRAQAWEKSHPDAYQIYPTNELDPWQ